MVRKRKKKKKLEDDFRTITVEEPLTTPPKPTVSFSKKSGLTVTTELEKQAEYTQNDVKKLDPILEEEVVEASQPFSDSTGGTVVLVDDSTDDSQFTKDKPESPKQDEPEPTAKELVALKNDFMEKSVFPHQILGTTNDATQVDPISNEVEDPTVVVDAVEYAEKILQLNELIESVKELPEPILMPTQRQYGEEYLPTYIKVRAKQRRIAGLP